MENKNLPRMTDIQFELYRNELEEELMNVLWYIKIRKKDKGKNKQVNPEFDKSD